MNLSRLAAAGVAAMVVGGALPAVASATDYCVYPDMSCGLNNEKHFEDAIAAATKAPDADRIFLGEDIYPAQLASGASSTTTTAARSRSSARGADGPS